MSRLQTASDSSEPRSTKLRASSSALNGYSSSRVFVPLSASSSDKFHRYDHQRYSIGTISSYLSSLHESDNYANTQRPQSEFASSFFFSSFLRIVTSTVTLGTLSPKTLKHFLQIIFCLSIMIHILSMIPFTFAQFYSPPLNIDTFYNSDKRRWLIAGNFTSISVNTTTFNNLNNIAIFNGRTWKGLGNGTNGHIRTVFIDTCFNMYAGGDFTQAGNLNTGPIARWSIVKRTWESISEGVAWKNNSSVRSISVDCFQTPSEISRCQCNVWIAGSFELNISDGNGTKTAINVAMYQSHSKTWFSMREHMDHNLTLSMTVNSIFKRDFGQTFHSRKTFLGGSFPYILTWDPYFKNWSKIVINDTNAEVTQIHFHKSTLGVYLFDYWNYVIAGNFEFSFEDGNSNSTCKNLCMIDFRNGKWTKVTDTFERISSSVRQVSTTDGHIFAIGNFNDTDFGNLAVINTDGISSSFFNNTKIPSHTYTSLYLCKQTDLECSLNSAGLSDTQGRMWFYDSDTRATHLFGTINAGGMVSYLSSIYLYFLSDYM
ncbi:hypothetical protein C9374_002646 [Naegleria lovaniensis]|uniref:Uncharacterized protein n=1 Tax=Naegleria lovaniensis TaxID=51637 RepID=A0AA88KJZ7_NAELO|nr:uncharacterized protein C9374_002646 [Naegleria lovaniensis]KAG2386200.1 hypothetical protein C9374_002646 [Naegleria lovaniensis]